MQNLSNFIDENGLTTQTLNEIITENTDEFKQIFGEDVVVDSNSPDGQLINIMSKIQIDILELATSIYNNLDPDVAIGRALDRVVALNGIQRKGATYATQTISITADRQLTLEGLDGEIDNPDGVGFTVRDDAQNEFILANTTIFATAGTQDLIFRAKNLGIVNTTPNTITIPSTVVLGVVGINNTSGILIQGTDEESDFALRHRRQYSYAINSIGGVDAIYSRLLNNPDIQNVIILEHDAETADINDIDANGIPKGSIWVIVVGGNNEDIAKIIYNTKPPGTGTKGDVEITIINSQNLPRLIKFDRPVQQLLYIKFDIKRTKPNQSFDEVGIKQYIADNSQYNLNDIAETALLNSIILQAINQTSGGGVPVNIQVSLDNITFVSFLEPTSPRNLWSVNINNISISNII